MSDERENLHLPTVEVENQSAILSEQLKRIFLGISETGPKREPILPDLDSNSEVYKHEDTSLLGEYIEKFLKHSEVINTSAEERRAYFASLSEDDFINLIKIVGGLLRGEKAGTLVEFDGVYEKAMGGGNRVPYPEDKVGVLKKCWSLASRFLNEPTIKNPYEALAYASVIATNAIVLVHPFVDMNGRHSRLFSYTIFNGAPDKEAWENVLSQSGGRTENGTWALDDTYTQRGNLLKFDKNSFANPQQPDIVVYDPYQSKAHGFMVREWSIRAIIDDFRNDYISKCLSSCSTFSENGESTLDGDKFLWEVVQGEQGISVESIKRLVNREINAGNFIRAMATESPYAYGDDEDLDNTVISPGEVIADELDETLSDGCRRARAMLKYFIPEVDFTNEDSIQNAILQLPLRKQVLVKQAKEIKEFERICKG